MLPFVHPTCPTVLGSVKDDSAPIISIARDTIWSKKLVDDPDIFLGGKLRQPELGPAGASNSGLISRGTSESGYQHASTAARERGRFPAACRHSTFPTAG